MPYYLSPLLSRSDLLRMFNGLIYALDGRRMCAGEVLYRDFFQFSTPGTSALYAVLIRTFGPRLWLPNLLLLAAGLGLAWVGVAIAKKVLRPGLALLPSALFLVAIYQNELDPTHHWLSLLACAGALAVLMERRTPAWILTAGALAGLAACFTQSRGLCAGVGMGVFLCWESRRAGTRWRELLRNQVLLATGFVTTLITANAYFAWKAGLARFLWCTAIFGARYYPQDAEHNSLRVVTDAIPLIPSMLSSAPGTLLYWFFIYVCVPVANLLVLVWYWKRPRSLPEGQWARLMLLAFVGIFLLLGVVPAPMATRVAASVPAGHGSSGLVCRLAAQGRAQALHRACRRRAADRARGGVRFPTPALGGLTHRPWRVGDCGFQHRGRVSLDSRSHLRALPTSLSHVFSVDCRFAPEELKHPPNMAHCVLRQNGKVLTSWREVSSIACRRRCWPWPRSVSSCWR